jgi:hypothetical protein
MAVELADRRSRIGGRHDMVCHGSRILEDVAVDDDRGWPGGEHDNGGVTGSAPGRRPIRYERLRRVEPREIQHVGVVVLGAPRATPSFRP